MTHLTTSCNTMAYHRNADGEISFRFITCVFRQEKFKTHNGIGMLIRQAAESFNFWFNISLKKEDIENVRKIIENK